MADQAAQEAEADQAINALEAPLYNAFTERYLLDEVRTLRQMIADLRVEATEKIVDREIMVASTAGPLCHRHRHLLLLFNRLVPPPFWYWSAGTPMRDIKERAGGAFANEEIRPHHRQLMNNGLDKLEEELNHKSRHIAQAQEEIELTNEIHSLWLKASQENTAEAKIAYLRSDSATAD